MSVVELCSMNRQRLPPRGLRGISSTTSMPSDAQNIPAGRQRRKRFVPFKPVTVPRPLKRFQKRVIVLELSDNPLTHRLPVIENEAHWKNLTVTLERDLCKRCNMHRHSGTCEKGRAGKLHGCRFSFPRKLVRRTFISEDGHVKLKRNDPWLNGYNPSILLSCRCNHDIRILASGP